MNEFKNDLLNDDQPEFDEVTETTIDNKEENAADVDSKLMAVYNAIERYNLVTGHSIGGNGITWFNSNRKDATHCLLPLKSNDKDFNKWDSETDADKVKRFKNLVNFMVENKIQPIVQTTFVEDGIKQTVDMKYKAEFTYGKHEPMLMREVVYEDEPVNEYGF